MMDFGIIAAGDGNRIKEEGSKVPKPLVEIDNRPMIGRLVKIMEGCGANSVSVIVNRDMPDVIEYLENLKPDLDCELKFESTRTPSSMHTFYELTRLMEPSDRFIVTTVDTIFRKEDFKKYVECFVNSSHQVDGLMGVTDYIDDEKPLYVETEGHRIIAYKDRGIDNNGEAIKLVSAGIYGLRRSALPILDHCIESNVNRMRNFQRALVEKGLVIEAYEMGKVLDVDHIGDIRKANDFLKSPEN